MDHDLGQHRLPAAGARISLYPSWCKGCGNCLAFCPRQALSADKWGHPYLPDAERCTGCGLCEMLCPDFAITVGESEPRQMGGGRVAAASSPERLAPAPSREEA
ncbi:MAG: 4Fe-4S binding protein [Thermodesulfobacteriota bacterium]